MNKYFQTKSQQSSDDINELDWGQYNSFIIVKKLLRFVKTFIPYLLQIENCKPL